MPTSLSLIHNYHEYLLPYDLSSLHIEKPLVLRNLSPSILYEEALRYETGSAISATGALIVSSNKYTGRLPKEKRFVQDEISNTHIHWGEINIPIAQHTYEISKARAVDYLNSRTRIYVVDGYAGWDKRYRIKVRTICSRAYHALFMTNMLIVPTEEELATYGAPDYTIINAGSFPANRHTEGVTSDASIIINLTKQEIVLLGTEYAGEMKKAIFSIINYRMPLQNILPMHCSANVDDADNTTIFFGLSGTGKTTLSSNHSRKLIGDDEHCWTDDGIFNVEGGCYAKCIDPPDDIKECLTFGSLLENVAFDNFTRKVNYHDETFTTNTRASYPLHHVQNVKNPSIGNIPKNIIFLACDAFGVLPPIAKLNEEQALYHFISGYTAKTPNTEVGIVDPTATFSACFGEAFLPLNPVVYAHLLAKKIKSNNVSVWLVNTGWIGGDFHTGKRISLSDTRCIIEHICNNTIDSTTFQKDPFFKFEICTSCKGIDHSLDPRKSWDDSMAYETQAKKLVSMFHKNIKKYDTTTFINGGPIPI